MSQLFDRVARVDIESDGLRTSIDGLRTQFYCYKSGSDTPNELTVRVYNANQRTRSSGLAEGATVRLLAGYGVPVLLAQAQATRSLVERTPPDTVLQIDCLDGISELRRVRVSLSFERGATARQVLDAIGAQLGYPLRPIEVNLDIPMRAGYSHVGGVGTALDDVCGQCDAGWSVQNGDLMVLGAGSSNPGEALIISPETGLLYSPEKLQSETDTVSVGGRSRDGYRLTCLLLPQVEPGQRIVLASADMARGAWQVDEVEHTGDTHGPEFYTTLTVLEVAP